jgi:hypothetical protein
MWVFIVDFICATIIAAKIYYVVLKKGRFFFKSLGASLDLVSIIGVLASSIAQILSIAQHSKSETPELFYTWAISCLFSIIAMINNLKQFTILRRLIDILYYAMKSTYPFLFIIAINFVIFCLIGVSVFGGQINSSTPDQYYEMVESELDPLLILLNWNDFPNAFVFLYAMTLNNNLITFINMSCVDNGKFRDNRGLFFFAFTFINNMMLFNIFVGMIIGISLEYFQAYLEEKKYDDLLDAFLDHDELEPDTHVLQL